MTNGNEENVGVGEVAEEAAIKPDIDVGSVATALKNT